MPTWTSRLLIALAALCGLPALYLLAIVYSASPVDAIVTNRKMNVTLGAGSGKSTPLQFAMSLRFRTPDGRDVEWNQQLPSPRPQEALMVFDSYPPGSTARIFVYQDDVVLRRGLPDWRFGLGWGLAVFTFVIGFYVLLTWSGTPDSPWLLRPQRRVALMGLAPLIFGFFFYRNLEAKRTSWPRVEVKVVSTPALPLLRTRANDLQFDAATAESLTGKEFESLAYTYNGRNYLYPAGKDVKAYDDGTHPVFTKVIDPEDPTSLSNLPDPADSDYVGSKVFMGFGAVFLALGLLVPQRFHRLNP